MLLEAVLTILQSNAPIGKLTVLTAVGVQHGANMAFILAELFFNSIPFVPYLMAFLGFYVATFGLWAFTYFRITGRWLYPVSFLLISLVFP